MNFPSPFEAESLPAAMRWMAYNVTPPTSLPSVPTNWHKKSLWLSAPWALHLNPASGQLRVCCDWSAAPSELKARFFHLMYNADFRGDQSEREQGDDSDQTVQGSTTSGL
ncbi:hypothetical protein LTR53_018043 [Teratosphaeriaceae sp. CCFEE 6253]|nr:hypothetical protein LTR53_018043 [Teratosphaeriaceae sp. CCFEE 6253]